MTDFADIMDEQRKYSRVGFARGYSLGEEAGWREGFLFGLKKGAGLATEIGFYQGYTTAWLTLLEKQDQGKARKVQALKALLEMARSFPLEEQLISTSTSPTNIGGSSMPGSKGAPNTGGSAYPDSSSTPSLTGKLTKIRAKFRQVQGLLTERSVTISNAPPGTSSGSSATTTTTGSNVTGQGNVNWTGDRLHPSSAAQQQQQSGHHYSTQSQPQQHFHHNYNTNQQQHQQQYQQWLHSYLNAARSKSPSAFVGRDSSFDSRTSTVDTGAFPVGSELSF